MKSYLDILKLVWPLALGMVNNAVMQFVDRIYLAHDSMESLEAALPAGVLMWIFAGFFQTVVGYSSVFVAQYHGAGEAANCRASTRAAFALAVAAGILSLPLVHVGGWVLSFSAPSAAVRSIKRFTPGYVRKYLLINSAASFRLTPVFRLRPKPLIP